MSADKGNDNIPSIKRIYFYMLEPQGVLTEYLITSSSNISYAEMPGRIDDIVKLIDEKKIFPSDSQQHGRDWRKRSYFVYYDRNGALDPNKPVIFTSTSHPNSKCFDDEKTVVRAGKVYAFYCINHMKKGERDLGSGETEGFTILLDHDHRHAMHEKAAEASSSHGKMEFTHNDSGTNTGPPDD